MNTEFHRLAGLFAQHGYLSDANLAALRNSAGDAELDQSTESLLRIWGASESLASRLLIEKSHAHLDMVARALRFAEGEPLSPEGAVALVAQMREARGEPSAELARALGCGRDWHSAADVVERLAAPRPAQRRAS